MRRTLLIGFAVLLVLGLAVAPLVLHFGLKRHSQLPFDVRAEYPMDQEFVKGEIFANTVSAIMRHELDSGTGWRPNDLVIWGPGLFADNKSNRQLGIIQVVRESVRVLRDHLTKVSATEYDQNLVDADTRFRNDEHKFWFPAAETRFEEGNDALDRYARGLRADPQTSKPINRRNVELIRLFQIWTDLLGDAHANLYREDESFWRTDDHFYHAQGAAHVMYHLTLAVRAEYDDELQGRDTVLELMDRILYSLGNAATLKPLMVLDGDSAGLFANHRRNLDAYIVDARQLMYSIREELEK
jgi:hypothetical protein